MTLRSAFLVVGQDLCKFAYGSTKPDALDDLWDHSILALVAPFQVAIQNPQPKRAMRVKRKRGHRRESQVAWSQLLEKPSS